MNKVLNIIVQLEQSYYTVLYNCTNRNVAMKKLTAASVILLSTVTLLSGCVIHVGKSNAAEGDDLSSIIGSINVSERRNAGDISSINGNVTMDDHASAESVDIVNGNLEVGEHVSIKSIDIVNGNIDAKQHLKVRRDIETVNGDISLSLHTHVGRDIESVNGDIELSGTTVEKDVISLNGDITLDGDTVINGDIVYRSREDSWNSGDSKPPTLTIASSVVVNGQIILKRPVTLDIQSPTLNDKVVVRYDSNQ